MSDKQTQDLLERAGALAEEALVEAQRLMAEREQTTQRIKELEGIARRFGRTLPSRSRSRGKRGPGTAEAKKASVTPARMLRTAELILERFPAEEFTGALVAEAHGHKSPSSVYPVFDRLRDLGFLRKAARRRTNGGPTPSLFWKVDHANVIEQLREAAGVSA